MEHWNRDLICVFQPHDSNFRDLFVYPITAGFINVLLVLYTTRDIKLDKDPIQNEGNDIMLEAVQSQ